MAKFIGFLKMHGTGNDFVIFDGRKSRVSLSTKKIREIADRKFGIGCDQLILIENSKDADCFMKIYNSDGGEVSSCGNATRCVGAIIMAEKKENSAKIRTKAGLLEAKKDKKGLISVNMGKARLNWNEIPLSKKMDTLHLDLKIGVLSDPVGVSMGNPHAVFFVDDVEKIDLARLGPALEHHKLFPERANIGVAEIESPASIRLRVWERGAGETLSCGTGACAALVAASRRGLTERKATIKLKGGSLTVEWLKNGHIIMSGPVAWYILEK